MLEELRIQNFAIIDNLELEFSPGFNVITGETGAGKSIIIDAVDLLLGGKADPSFVRAGAEKARPPAAAAIARARRRAKGAMVRRRSCSTISPDLPSPAGASSRTAAASRGFGQAGNRFAPRTKSGAGLFGIML